MTSLQSDFDYEAAIRRCALGEREALHALYEREARWLLGVAMRIVRRQELANEILHDAFLQIWQKSSGFDASLGSGRGWIYSIVRYRALDVIRSGEREQPIDAVTLDRLEDPAEGPLAQLARTSDTKALHRCLHQLDDERRACILLAYVDGLSQSQIAEQLGSPLGTVKAWIRRSLITLKDCLS